MLSIAHLIRRGVRASEEAPYPMRLAVDKKGVSKSTESKASARVQSPALEWLWQFLKDIPHPHILDCGPVRPPTVRVMLRRGAKLYVADLVSLAQHGAPGFWDRSGKHPVFRADDFLAQVPKVPAGSLSAIYGWHLFDLLPRDVLRTAVERLSGYLHPGGVLFCLLREPYMPVGVNSTWWLEDLTVLGRGGSGKEAFPYPALSNRDVERLVPGMTVKTFLTRSGLREVLLIK